MAKTNLPPHGAKVVSVDSKGNIIPFFCYVDYKSKSYQVIAYSHSNLVWLKPARGYRKIQVNGNELTLSEGALRG